VRRSAKSQSVAGHPAGSHTEIRAEVGPSPPPVAGCEIDTIETAAKLMEEAADEIDRNRRANPR
jgi:hypothetical protein